MPETPEQRARQQIDAQLASCGWIVQDFKAVDLSTGRGIALREVPLTTGPCDYLLLVDRKAPGVIEAKKVGTTLSTGTDIKPLEVLIFLRDVRSRVYFEQMKGRGTRVVTPPTCNPSPAKTPATRPASSSWMPWANPSSRSPA